MNDAEPSRADLAALIVVRGGELVADLLGDSLPLLADPAALADLAQRATSSRAAAVVLLTKALAIARTHAALEADCDRALVPHLRNQAPRKSVALADALAPLVARGGGDRI